MKLRVQYSAQLRAAVGCREEDVELADASGLADLLGKLALEGGDAIRAHLLTDSGKVRPSLMVVLNGVAISSDTAESTRLSQDDVVLLLPPIAGG